MRWSKREKNSGWIASRTAAGCWYVAGVVGLLNIGRLLEYQGQLWDAVHGTAVFVSPYKTCLHINSGMQTLASNFCTWFMTLEYTETPAAPRATASWYQIPSMAYLPDWKCISPVINPALFLSLIRLHCISYLCCITVIGEHRHGCVRV